MKRKGISVYSVLVNLFFVFLSSSYGEEIKIPLKELTFKDPTLRSIQGEYNIKVPIPSRYIVKGLRLHLEVEKSVALVKERSSISVFFNRKLVYQKPYDPLIDIVSADLNLPLDNLEPYNDITIKAVHHYCINCCEFEASPELWSKIDLDSSYILINYEEKPILPDSILIRDYILDPKLYNPVKLGIITEDKSDYYLSLATKLAGYIGNYIKYRKINIEYFSQELPVNKDIIVIGSKDFVRKLLGIDAKYIADIGILPNPKNITKGVVYITGNSPESIRRSLFSFMSVKNEMYTGMDYYLREFHKPDIKEYSTLISIPLGKRIYLKQLGYEDFKFSGIYPPPAIVEFRIPQGLFIKKNEKILFHFAYNYGAGTREDSVINIYLNDRYVTSLKIEKKYGVVLKEEDIKIPAYLLQGGLNRLKIEYAMMAPGGGYCISPNIEALRGTLFTDKSFIYVPSMPFWFEMPYLEYFIDSAFPFSLEGGMAHTAIVITNENEKFISSALTLSAYMGTRIFFPPYNIELSSNLEEKKDKNIIIIGDSIPKSVQDRFYLKISDEDIKIDIPLLKHIFNGNLLDRLLNRQQNVSVRANINYLNRITDQVFFSMGQSPFDSQRTILILYSKNEDQLYNSTKNLFEPKFAGQIKGDVAIWDFYENQYYTDNINEKYYIGNLPLIQKIIYTIGFDPTLFALSAVAIVVILSLMLKKILDTREKRRLEGEL
ncbi:MAG: cellulose biosynthesis cyclic di-GMP-binding regulatory protein BcsB [Hydrogenothermaceae bacterium]|nr:cellulose biosynthesis cyclic di-GMP-binding regulatory protein BcsB [Hydrogenothermaceae bacterium]